jgi:hypothetical protein
MIDLNELNIDKEIIIDNDYSFNESLSSIKKINKTHFKGKIYYNSADELKLEGRLNVDLILYDTVDLSDYPYKINENIDEILDYEQKTLDINEILWENIVLEVPIRATKHSDTELNGEGWKLNNDSSKKEIDPRLEKLQELFKGGE